MLFPRLILLALALLSGCHHRAPAPAADEQPPTGFSDMTLLGERGGVPIAVGKTADGRMFLIMGVAVFEVREYHFMNGHPAYILRYPDGWYVHWREFTYGPYESAFGLTVHGESLNYFAFDGERWTAYRNLEEGAWYHEVYLLFSVEGERVWLARRRLTWYLVWGNNLLAPIRTVRVAHGHVEPCAVNVENGTMNIVWSRTCE
jgi:hypothetical protein